MKTIKKLLKVFDSKYSKTEDICKKIQKIFRKFRNFVGKFRRIQKNQQFNCFD